MTKREAEFMLINRMQTLQLIQEALEEFEERDGKRGVEERIDWILDEINYYRNFIKNYKEDED